MDVQRTALDGVLLLRPQVFRDGRGAFFEAFRASRYAELGLPTTFVQDNFSRSVRGTIRGLHFQEPEAQGKLLQVVDGAIFDVVVDVRRGSPTFGKSVHFELSAENACQLWVPEGFAHGICVTSESALLFYKCTRPYAPKSEHAIRWNDPALAIPWPIETPVLSPRDAAAPLLADAPVLPAWPGKQAA